LPGIDYVGAQGGTRLGRVLYNMDREHGLSQGTTTIEKNIGTHTSGRVMIDFDWANHVITSSGTVNGEFGLFLGLWDAEGNRVVTHRTDSLGMQGEGNFGRWKAIRIIVDLDRGIYDIYAYTIAEGFGTHELLLVSGDYPASSLRYVGGSGAIALQTAQPGRTIEISGLYDNFHVRVAGNSHTITYHANGGTENGLGLSNVIDWAAGFEHRVRGGARFDSPTVDHMFAGWATEPNADLADFIFQDDFLVINEPITLYAQWLTEDDLFTALEELVEYAISLNLTVADFTTPAEFAVFEEALAEAQLLLTATSPDSADLLEAYMALREALGLLFAPADYTAVNDAIAAAQLRNQNLYTAASWANLQQVIANVTQGLLRAEQLRVDNYAAAILAAINALVLRPVDPGDQPPGNGGGVVTPPPTQQQPTDPDDEYDEDDRDVPLAPPGFVDVPGHWAREAIEFVHGHGIMLGVSDTLFAPDAVLTRAMMATILWRLEGEPTTAFTPVFSDVPAGRWYSEAIVWASEQDIVRGIGGGLFDPHSNITREQFAAMMHRYAVFIGVDTEVPATHSLAQFTDRAQVGAWALDYVLWVNYNELLTGVTATTLQPRGNVTRAQCATVLHRFIARLERNGIST